jgi:hypothetical protein
MGENGVNILTLFKSKMGQLNLNYLKTLSKGNTFVETGSWLGWTLFLTKKFGFQNIYGIELNPDCVQYCKDRFKDDPTIKILAGESPDILSELCPTLTEPVTFWLDAHASGTNLPGGKYGGCPLVQELEAINLSPCKDHVLFIDDVRLFGCPEWDYLEKEKVIEAIYNINPNYKISYIDGMEDGTLPNDILLATVDNK